MSKSMAEEMDEVLVELLSSGVGRLSSVLAPAVWDGKAVVTFNYSDCRVTSVRFVLTRPDGELILDREVPVSYDEAVEEFEFEMNSKGGDA